MILLQAAEGFGVLVGIGLFIVAILLIRLFGAWMLRINDVISELEKMNRKMDILVARAQSGPNED